MAILTTLQQVDLRLFAHLFRQGEGRPVVRPAAKIISRTGDGYLHLLLPGLMTLVGAEATGTFIALLAAVVAVERLFYFVLKNSLKRRRPEDFVPGFCSIVRASDEFSFPSGHTSASFCLATTTGIIFGGPFIALYLWACAVGLSRVLLGVHFPGDILAGALMGSSIAVLTANQLGVL